MLLYHGTNERWLDSIIKNGLRPRGRSQARNNWKHVAHQSNPRCVYLTDSYAPYFAFIASRGEDPSCAVVEVDTDLLDESSLLPDEDAWEQLGRGRDGIPGNMSRRTVAWRNLIGGQDPVAIRMFTADDGTTGWRLSLRALGTCCHLGRMPPEAITRAVRWPHRPNVRQMLVWDPTITLMNQRIVGDRYRALTRRLMTGSFFVGQPTAESRLDAMRDSEMAILPPIEGYELIELRKERQ